MSFTPQQSLAGKVSGIGVYDHSSPASVVYNGILYLFYLGSGDDGIFYTSTSNGTDWTKIVNVRDQTRNVGIAPNTSPSVAVFNNKIFLFYNGYGNDGTWYTTFDGTRWDNQALSISNKIRGQGFLKSSSPSAAVDVTGSDPKLYLFWNGAGDDGIYFTRTLDPKGETWTTQSHIENVGIAEATSPFAVASTECFYLFWNGRGNDGTYYKTLTNGSWTDQKSIKAQITSMGFLPGTSPTAIVLADHYLIRLFWVGSGGSNQGAWYSDFSPDKTSWTPQGNMSRDIGGQGFLPSTNPCTAMLRHVPYVFWVGYDKDLWLSSGLTFDVSEGFAIAQSAQQGLSFTVLSNDSNLTSYLQSKLASGMSIPPGRSDLPSTLVAKITGDWNIPSMVSIAPLIGVIIFSVVYVRVRFRWAIDIHLANLNAFELQLLVVP